VSTKTASEVAFLARALKAPRMRERGTALAERAHEGGWSYEEYLAALLSEEVSARESHRGAARMKAARFPAVKMTATSPSPAASSARCRSTSPSSTSWPSTRR